MCTSFMETGLLILIGASQTQPQQEREEGKRLEKRGKDEALNERRLISGCLDWHAGQRDGEERGMEG